MDYLIVDTPSPRASLVLVKGGKIFEHHLLDEGALEQLPEEVEKRVSLGINWIACSRGPGFFSPLRNGALVSALFAKFYTIPLFQYSSLAASIPYDWEGPFEVFLDARGGASYRGRGIKKGEELLDFEQDVTQVASEEIPYSNLQSLVWIAEREYHRGHPSSIPEMDYLKKISGIDLVS